MRREDLDDGPVDAPVREDLPERETPAAPERAAGDLQAAEGDGVEREAPVDDGRDAGAENPSAEPERAGLVP